MNVGVALQRARTERNLSLAMVTERTKIQPWVLEALESDRLQEVMSPIYVKGFLTNYAKFLHLDPGPLMTQLVPVPEPAPVISQPQLPPVPKAPRVAPVQIHIPWPLLRRLGSGLAVVAAIGALIVINPLKWIPRSTPASAAPQKAATSMSNNQKAVKATAKKKAAPADTASAPVRKPAAPNRPVTPPPSVIPTEPVRLATPPLTMASVAPISDPLRPEAPPTLTLLATQPLELLVNAKRPTWITVRADGRLIAEQRLVRGAKEHWTAKKQFELVIAKPAEVELTLNGQPISPFAVAHRGRMLITHRGITKLSGED